MNENLFYFYIICQNQKELLMNASNTGKNDETDDTIGIWTQELLNYTFKQFWQTTPSEVSRR